MTPTTDQANKLAREAESIGIYLNAIESRVSIGAEINETLRILTEKVRIFNEGFEELMEMSK